MNAKTALALLAGGVLLAAPASAGQQWSSERPPDVGACFYQYPRFEGPHFCARAGEDLSSIPINVADRVSSIRLFGGAQVVVNSWGRFAGQEKWFDYSVPDLTYDGWTGPIASVRVGRPQDRSRWDGRLFQQPRGYYSQEPNDRYPGGQNRDYGSRYPGERDRYQGGRQQDPGYRSDARTPDAIVQRAYEDLLGREPDAGGLQQYRDAMLNRGWSEAQVRESIMSSPEYKSKHR
jgi:hypothetical protein